MTPAEYLAGDRLARAVVERVRDELVVVDGGGHSCFEEPSATELVWSFVSELGNQ
jgi:hypothetical protein